MTVQRSVAARDASNNAFETAVGTAPLFRLKTGTQPANCAASRSGTILASLTLPSDWLAASSAGVKAKSGTWADVGLATGTVAHYEIMDSAGTTCHEQGTVTVTGGGGDCTVDNVSVVTGQTVTITAYSFTASNA